MALKMISKNKLENYEVYVIKLNDEVKKEPKFMKANPNYKDGKPCSYVGSTKIGIKERFRQHKTGFYNPDFKNKKGKATKWHNLYVKKYGEYLQEKQFKKLNPIQSFDDKEAKIQEAKLAEKLRKKGWGVWQN